MSLKLSNTYLAIFENGEYHHLIQELIYEGLKIEVLNPDDLGSKWSEVEFVESKPLSNSALLKTDQVLAQYQPKKLFDALIDHRVVANKQDLVKARSKEAELHQVIDLFLEFTYLESLQKKASEIVSSNKFKGLAFGHGLDSYKAQLDAFGQQVLDEFVTNHPDLELDRNLPEVDLVSIGQNHQVLIFDPANNDYVFDYKKSATGDFTIFETDTFFVYLNHEKEKLSKKLRAFGFDVYNLSKEKYTELCAFHANLELEHLVFEAEKHVFKLPESKNNSGTLFAFISVSPDSKSKFEQTVKENKVVTQSVEWDREIVIWNQAGGVEAFKGVAESLGTIGTKEFDPSLVITVFFSLFFAFCLGDAIYGLVLSLFCGYFLYFTTLKPGFKNIFRLFFFSGLMTVLLGALMNSWAGDIFVKTPLNPLLESVQLINPLDPNSPAIVNTWLLNYGISPIVALLGLSVFIGFLNIMIGYLIKIINSYLSGDKIQFLDDLSWFVFVWAMVILIVSNLFPTLIFPAQILAILSAVSLFVFNTGKGITGKILGGFGKIYNLISFGADLLSFTRLIAVGLTGSIIASVINLLGFLMFSAIPVPGLNFIVAAIVLIFGHLFNLVISLFGAYINPLRLHYVEFLPKFYEGKGRKLSSVNTEFKYLKLSSI